MHGKRLGYIFLGVFLLFALSVNTAFSYVNLEIQLDSPNFPPGQDMAGSVAINFDECFDINDEIISYLDICVDDCGAAGYPLKKQLDDYISKWYEIIAVLYTTLMIM